MLMYFNGYTQWEIIRIEAAGNIDFVNDSTGVVMVNTGTQEEYSYIARTNDYGTTWDTIFTANYTISYQDIAYVSESVLYVCGFPNVILKSTDAGQTWFDPSPGIDPSFNSLFFINDTLGYGAYGDGLPLCGKTTDGGYSWELYDGECAGRDLYFSDECTGYAPIGNGYYTTDNCADSWERVQVPMPNRTATDAWFFNSEYAFLGATGGMGTLYDFNYGSIIRTQDGGDSWYILDFPYMPAIFDLFFVNEQIGYACTNPFSGHPYSIIKTEDGGETWGYQDVEMLQGEDFPRISEIDCPSENVCYCAGKHIYKTTNGGGEIHDGWVVLSTTQEGNQELSIDLFPNPTNNTLTVKSSVLFDYLKMHDAAGREIHEEFVKSMNLELDMNHFPTGFYFITIYFSDGNSETRKFLKE